MYFHVKTPSCFTKAPYKQTYYPHNTEKEAGDSNMKWLAQKSPQELIALLESRLLDSWSLNSVHLPTAARKPNKGIDKVRISGEFLDLMKKKNVKVENLL